MIAFQYILCADRMQLFSARAGPPPPRGARVPLDPFPDIKVTTIASKYPTAIPSGW